MRPTVEKLRTYILMLGALLLVVICGFFVYARWKVRHFATDLPGKLGLDIQQSAKDFTLSRSDAQGRTVFTLRASKAVQYKGNGRVLLHDVTILLFNRKDGSAERVTGSEFDYDPGKGTARADGVVHMDLHAPPKPGSPGSASGLPPAAQAAGSDDTAEDENTIHVLMHGLLFDNKTGDASTEHQVEFRFPQAAGTAEGASYNAAEGTLSFRSRVDVTSSNDGRDFRIRANHAEFNRVTHLLELTGAQFETGEQEGRADHAGVLLAENGTVQHLTADGHIELSREGGAHISAEHGETSFDAHGDPSSTHLTGSIRFISQQAGRETRAQAGQATLLFAQRQVQHAMLRDGVAVEEDQVEGATHRVLHAQQLDLTFAPQRGREGSGVPPMRTGDLQQAVATGRAALRTVSASAGGLQQEDTIEADRIESRFLAGNRLAHLHGAGHTEMTSVGKDGQQQTSTADDLRVEFKGEGIPGAGKAGASAIESAVEQGNVVITQTAPRKEPERGDDPDPRGVQGAVPQTGGAEGNTVAHAERAEFQAGPNTLTLSGGESGRPSVEDSTLSLTARSIQLQRDSGDATASGEVKATYRGANGKAAGESAQQPLHVLGDTGKLFRAAGRAVFTGKARLWQGSSAIDAPVIEIQRGAAADQKQPAGRLLAHGSEEGGASGGPAVHCVFLGAGAGGRPPLPVRISSRRLLYSDADRLATFDGTVTVDSADGQVRADQALITLRDTAANGAAAPSNNAPKRGPQMSSNTARVAAEGRSLPPGGLAVPSNLGGAVERIVSTGHVAFRQPGRRGSGTRLVYTASDGKFVLTGTAAAPPTITDAAKGTVTGDSLIFLSRDDTVRVGREGR